MSESESSIEKKPYFEPVFDIGKPLPQEQLKGLINWIKEESYPNQVFTVGFEMHKIGFGIMAEPTGSRGVRRVDIKGVKLPKTHSLEIEFPTDPRSNRQENTRAMEKLATFASNAHSWGDTISIWPGLTTEFGILLHRSCNHPARCGYGRKSVARRILDEISDVLSPAGDV